MPGLSHSAAQWTGRHNKQLGTLLNMFDVHRIRLVSRIVATVLSLVVSDATLQATELPAAYSSVQGQSGFFYEQINDSRLLNATNPAPASSALLFFHPSDLPLGDRYIRSSEFTSKPSYPYIELLGGHTVHLHPGAGATGNIGVAIRFDAETAGIHNISGGFARQNVTFEGGNGVDVLATRADDLDHPLFASHIASSHVVDLSNPFGGTGVAAFDFTVWLDAGESLRFIVFSDGEGLDGDYDGTAFRVTILPVPEPSSAVLLVAGVLAVCCFCRQKAVRKREGVAK